MTMRWLVVSGLALVGASAGAQDWRSAVEKVLQSEPGALREAAIGEVVRIGPSWQEVRAHLAASERAAVAPGIYRRDVECSDGKVRPFVVVVPRLASAQRAPMVVWLHGGASRAALIANPLEWAKGAEMTPFADRTGSLVVYPFAQEGAAWWQPTGMAMIRSIVRRVKEEFLVDDDRVALAGFSDGASGAWLHAMLDPDPYAAFVALNGHLGVGSEDGQLHTYLQNLVGRPVFATSSDADELYPTEDLAPMMAVALDAGADLLYRPQHGRHEFDFAERELPRIAEFLARHPRDPYPARLAWETADPRFGRRAWIQIDSIEGPEAPWRRDWMPVSVDKAIVVGILPDDAYEGKGVRVGSVPDGDTLARRVGLQAGDLITRGGTQPIGSLADLSSWKRTLHRGDKVRMVIERAGKEVVLEGQLPEIRRYDAFRREKPSAAVRGTYLSNRFDLQGSRLGAFRILIHPEWVDLEEPVVVVLDGKEVFRGRVQPDLGTMLERFASERDLGTATVAEIRIPAKRS